MLTCALTIHLLFFSNTFAADIAPPQSDLNEQATMQDNIQTLIQSLQLVPSQHQDLISRLESTQTANGNINFSGVDLACQVARATLEPDSVATKPVNQIDADGNWSVIPQCCDLPRC